MPPHGIKTEYIKRFKKTPPPQPPPKHKHWSSFVTTGWQVDQQIRSQNVRHGVSSPMNCAVRVTSP